jgi:uncharacterized radical SAM superfamily Fe-S cluster-containing enzyme
LRILDCGLKGELMSPTPNPCFVRQFPSVCPKCERRRLVDVSIGGTAQRPTIVHECETHGRVLEMPMHEYYAQQIAPPLDRALIA